MHLFSCCLTAITLPAFLSIPEPSWAPSQPLPVYERETCYCEAKRIVTSWNMDCKAEA